MNAGPYTDIWIYNNVCSVTVTVPKGQKFVVLTQAWRYATGDAKYFGAAQPRDFTVTVLGLVQPYTFSQHGDTHTPPPAPWISDYTSDIYSFWHLNPMVNVFDVSSLTQAGDIPLTLQLEIKVQENGFNFSALSVDLGFYGGTSLKLTQTPSAFRPRDARDAASECSANDGDCHPQFTVTLAGLGSYQMSQGNDIYWPDLNALSPSIAFTLAPATVPPPSAGPWLAGTSTNYGADKDTDPDYLFEQGQQTPTMHLTVQDQVTMVTDPGSIPIGLPGDHVEDASVTPSVTPPITFKVTSSDFGGKAYLRAALTLAPGVPPVYAEIVDANGPDVPPPVDNAATKGTCGTDFAAHPFASLPVDRDCNGIADSWEDANSTQNGAHLPPDWDMEQGYAANSPKGDGYSVHDEYRGFHYVTDDGKTVRWTWTDPLNKLDVFFWDPTNHYTQPLRSILSQQGADRFVYRRVTAAQANAGKGHDPSRRIPRLNLNSVTLAAQEGYAVTFAEKDLNWQTPGTSGTARKLVLGMSPSIHNDGFPVQVDPRAMSSFLQLPDNGGFPAATLTAEVVAHETGHHFGQFHPERPGCCTFVSLPDTSQLPSLTGGQFAFVGVTPDRNGKIRSATVYVRLTQYQQTATGHLRDADDLLSLGMTSVDNKTGRTTATRGLVVLSKTVALADPTTNSPVFKVTLQDPLDSTATVSVQNQLLEMMDWTPNLNLTAPGQWHFDPLNLQQLCVRLVCQQ
jgi:hypothetical protein